MDAKESRTEAALTERGSDGGAKFAPQYDRSKCSDAGASSFKGDTTGSRPCAVIGPDRVVPPARDCPKKAPVEPWLTPETVYRRLPDYPHKMSDHKDPSRNISPRQTFQENMQRIIMPLGHNAIKLHEDPYTSKNNKFNMPLEVKYCDVPYNINPISSDQKHIRNPDHSASNLNPILMRGPPQGWPASSVNIRPLRPYGASEVLQYPDYANCTGPRPRTHTHEELQQLYPEPYYHENNVRFKPYPNIKERYPQSRYEYVGNYSNPYHPPHPYTHKYETPKTMPPHPYTGYPPVPVKYAERVPEHLMDRYQRAFSQQHNYSVAIRNPVIHPPYRPMPGNHMQNKLHPYPTDGQHKPPVTNKLPFDPTSKVYFDYDSHTKTLPVSDNYYLNELPRSYQAKNTIVLPNYASANMHGVNTHPYYIKENMSLKNYEYAHLKNMDVTMMNHSLTKLPPQFSPSTLAISPADSNASNETVQTHGTAQEDCGYASQSSVTSVRSIESLNRVPMDPYGRYDYRYGPVVRTSPSSKPETRNKQGSNSKKDIRQFISSWSEGDDENAENSAKKDSVKTITDNKHTFSKQNEAVNNQDQLYVLGLVNVPSEELSKYEHIQKVSKLPENIKGYNSLELLTQFEEAIESSNITSAKALTPRALQMPMNIMSHKRDSIPRAVSPLDVEAKISQSVIHKEVGCNFEIKPCSPKMLNVEVATPMQTLMNERVIEKVTNPLSVKSPIVLQSVDENRGSTLINKSMKYPAPNTAPSCKMINGHHLSESSAIDHLKTNYSLQDLESSSGVCLASLPRLDTDIELNFPEVNQQFINANKADSVITSLPKDLPTLNVEQSDCNPLKNAISVTDYDMNYQFSPKMENETDFSRLSKYRKLKRNVPDDNGFGLAKAQAARVDSVIIKNPDNTRSLEDGNDTLMSGGYFRNESQEFAMNLVSQAKHFKANHQHEMDKMFSTSSSTVSTSRYDDTGINSRSNVAAYTSLTTINKSFNVIGDTSRKNIVQVQSEDQSLHTKDLSNRCLENAALDMPMNLSPQAKYSMVGEDEDMRNNLSQNLNQKDAIPGEKRRLSLEAMFQNNNEQEEQQNTCTVSLDNPDGTYITSKDVTILCDKKYHEDQNKKPNISEKCSSSDFIKQCDDDSEICKNEHVVLRIDQAHTSAVKTSYEDKESGFEKNEMDSIKISYEHKESGFEKNEMDSQSLDKIVETSRTREIEYGNVIDDKIDVEANGSNAKRNDGINHKDQESKHYISDVDNRIKNVNVSKLKRKKNRAEVIHRKRSKQTTARVPGTNVKSMDNINRKVRNLKIPLISETGKSLEKFTYGEPKFRDNDVPAEKNDVENSTFKKVYSDDVKNETTVFNLESASNNETTKYVEGNMSFKEVCSDSAKNGTIVFSPANVNNAVTKYKENIDSDIATENFKSTNFPEVTDKSLEELSSHKKEAIPQQDLPTEISDEITKKSNGEHMLTPKNTDLNSYVPLISSKNLTSMDDSSKILPFDQNELQEKTISYTNTQSKEKEVDTLIVSDQDERQPREKQVNLSDSFIHNELNTQKQPEKTNFIPPTNDDAGQDNQILSKVNTPKVCPERNFTKNMSDLRTYVSKELFSPRFQNLLIYDDNGDVFLSGNKRRSVDLHTIPQKTEIVPYQPVNQDPEICATRNTVSKELFSSRFQNLLMYDGNSEAFASGGEGLTVDLQTIPQKTEIVPYQPVIQDPEICATLDTGMINTTQIVNDSTNNGNTLENLSSDLSKCGIIEVNKACLPEEGNRDIINEKLAVTSAEFANSSNDLNKLNSDLTEDTNIEINKNSAKTTFTSVIQENSYETPNQSAGDIETIADLDTLRKPVNDIITKPFCDETVNDYDKEFENNRSYNDVQQSGLADTFATNIIVIGETSMTQGQCNDYKRFDRSGVNTCEFYKKIQSSKNSCDRPRFALKRSLSDSALDAYVDDVDESSEKRCFMLPKKRKKLSDIGNINESHLLNIIQSSRRNSISTPANENFSFCILIDDDCIVGDENYEQQNDFVQLEDNSSNQVFKNYTGEHEKSPPLLYTEDQIENNSDTCITKCDEEKTWVDDVGCEETIDTEDIAENIVIGEPVSPKYTDESEYESDNEEMGILIDDAVNHTSKVKHIYGDNLCTNDAQLVDALYRTPQMDVNKKLMDRESQITEKSHKYYDSDSLEMLLAEPVDNIRAVDTGSNIDCNKLYSSAQAAYGDASYKQVEDTASFDDTSPLVRKLKHILTKMTVSNEHIESINSSKKPTNDDEPQDGTVHSSESSLDNVFSYIRKGESSCSPEVSSTTSEENNSSILLKISNCKGSRISEVKGFTYDKQQENSCKLTEKVYLNANYNNIMGTKRPLLTKAAQKYIPPIRESIPDLKIKLALPQQSLMKLQKNKLAKEEPKLNTRTIYSSTNNTKAKQEIPRKVKPKFEDVLKNIDEVQLQMHKEKNKKPKKYIPKVVIKKSENGSHYASTPSKESFNPDLTGRKWQPWVFIEKNQFIDKMALRNKTRAVFSHRRRSYVLADKFCKYKSISSPKFIISQPKINDFSTGNLKYTIKLKHTY